MPYTEYNYENAAITLFEKLGYTQVYAPDVPRDYADMLYEGQENGGEPFKEKMARLTGEISALRKQSHELEKEIRRRLGAIGYEI